MSELPPAARAPGRVSILLADDHAAVRIGVRAALDRTNGLRVVGETTTGRDTVQQARELQPDVVVMDLWMPNMNGVEATRRVRQALPQTQVLIYSVCESEDMVAQALIAGACGYVLKSDGVDNLCRAVVTTGEGRPFFSAPIARMILRGYLRSTRAAGPLLSDDDREMLRLLAAGDSSADVARVLGISEEAGAARCRALMHQVRAESVAELVRYAVRNRLIEP